MKNQRTLGRSQLTISPIVYGAWAIGKWLWGEGSEQDALDAITQSIDHGVLAIDTAPIYGMGLSEELVGKAIKGRRDKVVIMTKCGLRHDTSEGSDPWHTVDLQGNDLTVMSNSNPKGIIKEFEESVKRLNVDVIDLYQIHWPDTTVPIEESWSVMAQLKKEGKVRAIGVSNYNLEQLKRAHAIHPVDSLQPPYSLVRRNIEKDLIPFCKENKISILAYSPLERGLLAGKIGLNHSFKEGDHRATNETFSLEHRKIVLEALEKLRPIAASHACTFAQLIIAATYARDGITAAIVGARNGKQAIENAEALNISFSKEDQEFIAKTFEKIAL